MSIIALPTGFIAADFSMGIQRNDMEERSDVVGSRASRPIGPPQWTWHVRSPQRMTPAQVALWKAMLLGLDGMSNYLSVWNIFETAPRGTMRGTMTCAALAAGATSATITAAGQGTNTLLAGDWLQIGTGLTGQLVMLTADAAAVAGVININFKHPMRFAQSGGTSVTWDKALGHYKMMTPAPGWAYDPGTLMIGGFDLDFLEQW